MPEQNIGESFDGAQAADDLPGAWQDPSKKSLACIGEFNAFKNPLAESSGAKE